MKKFQFFSSKLFLRVKGLSTFIRTFYHLSNNDIISKDQPYITQKPQNPANKAGL